MEGTDGREAEEVPGSGRGPQGGVQRKMEDFFEEHPEAKPIKAPLVGS